MTYPQVLILKDDDFYCLKSHKVLVKVSQTVFEIFSKIPRGGAFCPPSKVQIGLRLIARLATAHKNHLNCLTVTISL